MTKNLLTKGAISLLILVGGWASPSVLVQSQEAEETDVENTTVTKQAPVSLQVTSGPVTLNLHEEIDPEDLVVAGYYDTLSLPVVDTSLVGNQTLTFKATRGLEEVTVTKTISVNDNIAPEFTEMVETLKVEYDEALWEEDLQEFFKATDNVDGDLRVTFDGSYDETVSGEYDLVAVAEDSSGNRVEFPFVVEVAEKPAPVYTPVSSGSSYTNYGTANTYGAGWCTWWAAQRRIEVGKPLPNTLGHAMTWLSRAPSYGLTVVWGKPRLHSVVSPSYNHVAFVERVNADGSIYVTEMGWGYRAWGYNSRTISASRAANMGYIY